MTASLTMAGKAKVSKIPVVSAVVVLLIAVVVVRTVSERILVCNDIFSKVTCQVIMVSMSLQPSNKAKDFVQRLKGSRMGEKRGKGLLLLLLLLL